MTQPAFQPNFFQKALYRLGSTKQGAWLFSHTLPHLDRPVLRLSNGRYSTTGLFSGLPIMTLATTGAKSSQPRSVTLIAVPHEGNIILIASNWGGKKHPAWYYNLKATPACTLAFDNKTEPYLAREVEGTEREVCWQIAAGTVIILGAGVWMLQIITIPTSLFSVALGAAIMIGAGLIIYFEARSSYGPDDSDR